MDIIFDIDGTLANADHRLHFIKDSAYFVPGKDGFGYPDWDTFLEDGLVAKDEPIPQVWAIMKRFILSGDRILWITGRKESSRSMTTNWLFSHGVTQGVFPSHGFHTPSDLQNRLYMRPNGDFRPSHKVKRVLLNKARSDGFDPTVVFEDRINDTLMWRSEGLLCCQVAEGNY